MCMHVSIFYKARLVSIVVAIIIALDLAHPSTCDSFLVLEE